MTLLLDIGNSRIKWAWWDGRLLHGHNSLAHEGEPPSGLPRALAAGPATTRAVICSVAGDRMNTALAELLAGQGIPDHRFVTSGMAPAGVTSSYPDPASLGADRWAALLATHALGLAPACIIDCGTAVTVDLLDAEGRHRGGLIFAGLGLSRRALTEGTYHLDDPDGGDLPEFAADTATAMRSGTVQALVGAVEYTIVRATRVLGGTPVVVLTGGDAAIVAERISVANVRLQPDLVLLGLAVVAEQD